MRNLFKASVLLRSLVLASLAIGTAHAQQRGQQAQPIQQNASAQLEILPIRGNLYMLAGAGANIALSVGPDGVLIVDTGTAQNSDRILAAVLTAGDFLAWKPLLFVAPSAAFCLRHPERSEGSRAASCAA